MQVKNKKKETECIKERLGDLEVIKLATTTLANEEALKKEKLEKDM